MSMPIRKSIRLKDYDYSSNGTYFITICTESRLPLLSTIVKNGEEVVTFLTAIGKEIEKSINFIGEKYKDISVDKYVIMPDHIHMLISLKSEEGRGNTPLQDVLGRFKSYTTHLYGKELWQRSYIDHVIRNKEDYVEKWKYIENNPLNRFLKENTK